MVVKIGLKPMMSGMSIGSQGGSGNDDCGWCRGSLAVGTDDCGRGSDNHHPFTISSWLLRISSQSPSLSSQPIPP